MSDGDKDRGAMNGFGREPLLNNGVYIERNKMVPIDQRLLYPHYSDTRFRQRKHDGKVGDKVNLTVFLDPDLDEKTIRIEKGSTSEFTLNYTYGDRLQQLYGREAVDKAWQEVDKLNLPKNSAASFEAYLRSLMGRQNIDIKHIVSYVDNSGWGQLIYGFLDQPQ